MVYYLPKSGLVLKEELAYFSLAAKLVCSSEPLHTTVFPYLTFPGEWAGKGVCVCVCVCVALCLLECEHIFFIIGDTG